MPLSSIESKELVVAFGRDLNRIADDLYEASTEDVGDARKAVCISAGERKLRDYQTMLEKLQGAKRSEVEKRFGETVTEIQDYVNELKKK